MRRAIGGALRRQHVATEMLSNGMKEAGYEYVNIDDCWQVERYADKETAYLSIHRGTDEFKAFRPQLAALEPVIDGHSYFEQEGSGFSERSANGFSENTERF